MNYNTLFLNLLGITAFLAQMQMLHLLRYSKTIAIFGRTLQEASTDLISVAQCFLLVFLAFCSLFYISVGPLMPEYSSFRASMAALTSAFLGKFDFHRMMSSGGEFGAFMLYLYLVTMVFFIVNIFLVILGEFLSAVSQEAPPKDHEVIDHMVDIFKGFMSGSKKNKEKEVKEKGMA